MMMIKKKKNEMNTIETKERLDTFKRRRGKRDRDTWLMKKELANSDDGSTGSTASIGSCFRRGGTTRKRSAEEKHVTFWTVNHVVNPSGRLLNTETSPLGLRHEPILGNEFGDLLGDMDVTILELLVLVLVRIVEIVRSGRHSF